MNMLERIEQVEKTFPIMTREEVRALNPALPEVALELVIRAQAPMRRSQRVNLAGAMVTAINDVIHEGADPWSPESTDSVLGLHMILPMAALQGVGGPLGLGRFSGAQLQEGQDMAGTARRSLRLWPFSRLGSGRSQARDGRVWDQALEGVLYGPEVSSLFEHAKEEPELHPLRFSAALRQVLAWVTEFPDGFCTGEASRRGWAGDLVEHMAAIAGRKFLEAQPVPTRILWARCYEETAGWVGDPAGLPVHLMAPHVKRLEEEARTLWSLEQKEKARQAVQEVGVPLSEIWRVED